MNVLMVIKTYLMIHIQSLIQSRISTKLLANVTPPCQPSSYYTFDQLLNWHTTQIPILSLIKTVDKMLWQFEQSMNITTFDEVVCVYV